MDYFLTSKLLGFRRWREEDFPLAMGLWGDPEVAAYIGGPFTEKMVRSRLQQEIKQEQETGLQYWPFFLLDGNRHAGCAVFVLIARRSESTNWEFICGAPIGGGD
jgi:[ribosomal protein S5]-alanine N-acetyltransferase